MRMTDEQRVALYNHNIGIYERQLRMGYAPNYPTVSLMMSRGRQRVDYIIDKDKRLARVV